MNNLRKALSITLIIGMLISLFLLYEHFSPSASKFCTFGKHFDCGIVNKSPYANIDGIFYLLTIDFNLNLPLINVSNINWFFDLITANAFLGFLTLLFLFILNKNPNKKVLWIKPRDNRKWVISILIFGVIYGVGYLFAIQHFVLYTYCLFCLLLDIAIITSLILAIKIKN
ncbi:MAG: vitamin K epoxide reductase family protein [Nanoarchaeota archaeon]